MLQPVKIAFGEYLGRYFASLAATTQPLKSYVTRPLLKAISWAPARMVDAADDMLALCMRTDLDDAPTTPPRFARHHRGDGEGLHADRQGLHTASG